MKARLALPWVLGATCVFAWLWLRAGSEEREGTSPVVEDGPPRTGHAETRAEAEPSLSVRDPVSTPAPAAADGEAETSARIVLALEFGAAGAPAADTRVRVVPNAPTDAVALAEEAIADAAGRIAFEVEPGEWIALVDASAAHGTAATQWKLGTLEPGQELALRVPLPAGVTVEGVVLDVQGRGVAGARVRELLPPAFAAQAAVATTRADGSFSLGLLPDGSKIVAEGNGLRMQHAWPVEGGAERRCVARLTLREVALPHGRVLCEGLPVANARISFEGMTGREEHGVALRALPAVETVSGADGSFRFEEPTSSPSRVFVRAAGHAPALFEELVWDDAPIDLEVERSLPLEIVVRDDAGAPVEGARVRASLDSLVDPDAVLTDAAGRARVEGLPLGGVVSVFVHAAGFRSIALEEQRPDFRRPLELVLQRSIRLEGTVVDVDGAPFDDCRLYLHRYVNDELDGGWIDHTVPREGRFGFDLAEGGRIAVFVHVFRPPRWMGPFEVRDGSENRVVVDPGPRANLAVHVRDALSGRPIPRFFVTALGQRTHAVEGTFARPDAPVGAPIDVTVEAEGYAVWREKGAAVSAEGATLDVRLWPSRDLTVVVEDERGRPLPFATATIHDDPHAEMRAKRPRVSGRAGSDGSIRLVELPGRPLRLEVRAFAGGPGSTQTVDLTSPRSAPLVVRFPAPPVAPRRIRFVAEDSSLPDEVHFAIQNGNETLASGDVRRGNGGWSWSWAGGGGWSEEPLVELELPAIDLGLHASARGRADVRLPLPAAGGEQVIPLRPAPPDEDE